MSQKKNLFGLKQSACLQKDFFLGLSKVRVSKKKIIELEKKCMS